MSERENETLMDSAQPEEESLLSQLGMKEGTDDLETMKALAERGEESALMTLGNYYMDPSNGERDLAEAIYWFEKWDDACAMVNIAKIYKEEGDNELAREYYIRALSARGDYSGEFKAAACLSLALDFVKEDPDQSEQYLLQAEERGIPEGYEGMDAGIAAVLSTAIAANGDPVRALRWGLKAIRERDDADTRKRLLLLASDGVKKDQDSEIWKLSMEAMEFLAEKKERLALMVVFQYWNTNKDAKGNPEKYREWLVKAADGGEPYAQFLLAREYVTGEGNRSGFPVDLEKCRKYFALCEEWLLEQNNGKDLHDKFQKMIELRELRELQAAQQGGSARQAGTASQGSASAGRPAGTASQGSASAGRQAGTAPQRSKGEGRPAVEQPEDSEGLLEGELGERRREVMLTREDAIEIFDMMERTRSTTLVIPDGIEEVTRYAFSSRGGQNKMKYAAKVEHIVFPESVVVIGRDAFEYMPALKDVKLPPHLEFLGEGFIDNDRVNFLNMWVRDKRVFDLIEIPATTELEEHAFSGIHQIVCLRFLDGRKSLDWNFIHDGIRVNRLIVPDSVEKMVPLTTGPKVLIDTVSLPKHLAEPFRKMFSTYRKIKIEIR